MSRWRCWQVQCKEKCSTAYVLRWCVSAATLKCFLSGNLWELKKADECDGCAQCRLCDLWQECLSLAEVKTSDLIKRLNKTNKLTQTNKEEPKTLTNKKELSCYPNALQATWFVPGPQRARWSWSPGPRHRVFGSGFTADPKESNNCSWPKFTYIMYKHNVPYRFSLIVKEIYTSCLM